MDRDFVLEQKSSEYSRPVSSTAHAFRQMEAQPGSAPGAIVERVQSIVCRSPGISLEQLQPLALLDRMDTKYVLHHDQLCEALDRVIHEYDVLEINHVRPGRYITTYFDTSGFGMYFAHHNGERARYKLRCRSYLDSRMVFVEVKMKNNKNRMVKFRRQIDKHVHSFDCIDPAWLPPNFPYHFADVQPVVWNRFRRMTLANFEKGERITVDVDIYFGCGDREFSYEGLAVVEVKQPKFSLTKSPLAMQLHRMHLNPCSISKFCIAASAYYSDFKINHFKPLLLYLDRHFVVRGHRERTV